MTATAENQAPVSLQALLAAAIDRRRLERAKLEQATQELEHHRQIAAQHQQRFTEAVHAEEAASIEDAPKFAAARRDVEAMVDAADRQVGVAAETHSARQRALNNAEQEVAMMADRLLLEEAEDLATEILKLEERAVELRERLLGSYEKSLFYNSRTVIDSLEMPWREGVSRYKDMLSNNGPHHRRIAEHRGNWEKRRAGLIAGDICK